MSNSALVTYTKLSPCCSKRTQKIKGIIIHCMAGNLSVQRCGDLFANKSRGCSSNYGVDSNGNIALYVSEENRAWTTGSKMTYKNINGDTITGSFMDNQSVTIEVANIKGAPNWEISEKALDSLILLVADICRRNGIEKLYWKNDKMYANTDKQNLFLHRWVAAKACPGNDLVMKHEKIVNEANKLIGCYVPVEPSFVETAKNEPDPIYHVVVKGDTLSKIAKQYGTTVDLIMSYNSIIKKANLIQIGWKIRVK